MQLEMRGINSFSYRSEEAMSFKEHLLVIKKKGYEIT